MPRNDLCNVPVSATIAANNNGWGTGVGSCMRNRHVLNCLLVTWCSGHTFAKYKCVHCKGMPCV